jgi:Myb-like DNA-binding domain
MSYWTLLDADTTRECFARQKQKQMQRATLGKHCSTMSTKSPPPKVPEDEDLHDQDEEVAAYGPGTVTHGEFLFESVEYKQMLARQQSGRPAFAEEQRQDRRNCLDQDTKPRPTVTPGEHTPGERLFESVEYQQMLTLRQSGQTGTLFLSEEQMQDLHVGLDQDEDLCFEEDEAKQDEDLCFEEDECNDSKPILSLRYHPWTADEDARLSALVKQRGNQWKAFAPLFPGRTARQLKDIPRRWERAATGETKKVAEGCSLRQNLWTADEDARLSALVEKRGNQWTAFAPLFPGRAPHQLKEISRRWERAAAGCTKRGKYTPAEHEEFLKAYEKHGRQWTLVHRDMKTDRSLTAIINYGKRYVKRYKKLKNDSLPLRATKRRKVALDANQPELSSHHIKDMLAHTDDIVAPSAQGPGPVATAAAPSTGLLYYVHHAAAAAALSAQVAAIYQDKDALARPTLADDGQLAPALAATFADQNALVMGQAYPFAMGDVVAAEQQPLPSSQQQQDDTDSDVEVGRRQVRGDGSDKEDHDEQDSCNHSTQMPMEDGNGNDMPVAEMALTTTKN